MKKTQSSKEGDLEKLLENGITVTMTKESPHQSLAKKYNLHVDEPYRLVIAGTNPMDTVTYDGMLTSITVYADEKGFTPKEIVLQNGLWKCDLTDTQRKPFEQEIWKAGSSRLIAFGSIIDKEGFYRAKQRVLGK